MPYVLICLMVGLAIFALTVTIVEVYPKVQQRYWKWSGRRAADLIWKESDR